MELVGVQTPETIAKWKSQHPSLFEVKIGNSVGYFRKPDRQVIRAAYSFLHKDRIRYVEVIVENCWLGGDETIKTDDSKFLSLIEIVPELTTFEEAELKKL